MVDQEQAAVSVRGDLARLTALASRVQVIAAIAILSYLALVIFNIWAFWLSNDDPMMRTYRQWRVAVTVVDVGLWYLAWWHVNAWIREKGDLERGGRLTKELLTGIIGARGMQRWRVLLGATVVGLLAAFAAIPLASSAVTVTWGHALAALMGLCLIVGIGEMAVLVREGTPGG
jgi:hypothetical protein